MSKQQQSQETVRCAFCGEAYPPGTPPSQHQRLTEHIRRCPAHPVRADLCKLIQLVIGAYEEQAVASADRPIGARLVEAVRRLARQYDCAGGMTHEPDKEKP